MPLIIRVLFISSLFISQYVITSDKSLEGNWIGASNPEIIINLSIQDDNFVAHEIDYRTSQMKEEPLFNLNLSKNVAQSSDRESELVLIREDILPVVSLSLPRVYSPKPSKLLLLDITESALLHTLFLIFSSSSTDSLKT